LPITLGASHRAPNGGLHPSSSRLALPDRARPNVSRPSHKAGVIHVPPSVRRLAAARTPNGSAHGSGRIREPAIGSRDHPAPEPQRAGLRALCARGRQSWAGGGRRIQNVFRSVTRASDLETVALSGFWNPASRSAAPIGDSVTGRRGKSTVRGTTRAPVRRRRAPALGDRAAGVGGAIGPNGATQHW
jgi:hypothetical protein